jgi:hypothetical protein
MGQVICLMLLVYLQTNNSAPLVDGDFATLLSYLVPSVALLAFSAGSYIYRTRLEKAKALALLAKKLDSYKAVMITRFAVWEGASMFSLVAYFLTGSNWLLGISVVYIFLFIILRPTPDKLVYEMELNPEEKALLENPDSVVI